MVLYYYCEVVQFWVWYIIIDNLLDNKTSVTIYFYLIKYHQGNVIKVMLENTSFLE